MSRHPHRDRREGSKLTIYRERKPHIHKLWEGVTIHKERGNWELKKDGKPINSRGHSAVTESGKPGFKYLKEAKIFGEGYIAALADIKRESPK